MSRKRIVSKRSKHEIETAITARLRSLPSESPSSSSELRVVVTGTAGLYRDVRELGVFYVKKLLTAKSASERILQYFQLFVGQELEGGELEVVSGISEYARRIREWRVEFGWPIEHKKNRYVLLRDTPDEAKAALWQTVNAIRRADVAARDKMLMLFRALPVSTPITTAQLRYVTEGKDMRRVRELRTQFGWRIMTNKSGAPELKNSQYVLADSEQMEPHDRHIDDSTIVQILKRDGNKCRKCGWHPKDRIPGDPRQYIELHHRLWHSERGSNESDNLITLCNVHHREVHTKRIGAEDLERWLKASA